MANRLVTWPAAAGFRYTTSVLALTVSLLWLFTVVTPSEEAVKVRNSLVAQVGEPADFDWAPEETPPGFLGDSGRPHEAYRAIRGSLLALGREDATPGLDGALAISEHLMKNPERRGGPIQRDTVTTYREIIDKGRGYCADFTQVFNAIAITAGLPVREWSIAFDAFGSGHAFNEIYDSQRGKWILVDSFHSLYFVDSASEEPLSVLGVHDRLLSLGTSDGVEIRRIGDGRIPFRSDDLALDYYRRGMSQLALLWGNNVFDYERQPLVRFAARFGRSAEQAMAILAGVYPEVVIYPTGVSQRDVDALFRKRQHFFLALGAVAVSGLLMLWQVVAALVRRRPSVRRTG